VCAALHRDRELNLRTEVTFCDKMQPNDPGFTFEFSLEANYDTIARTVADYLGTDPYLLQFMPKIKYVYMVY